MENQGRRANSSGNLLEQTVKNICIQKGFKLEKYQNYVKNRGLFEEREILLTNVPYKSVYGHNGKTEFLLKSEKYGLKTRIECKWQQVSGSVDEKLPYLYLNCIESMPEEHIILIVDGGGWKNGAVDWLKNAAKEKKYTCVGNCNKLIEVMSLSEFLAWANRTLC